MPVIEPPPITLVGLAETDEIDGARTVSAPVFVTPPYTAEMFAVTFAATAVVVIEKLYEEYPAGIVPVAAIVAAALSLDSVTVTPPAGAAPVRYTYRVAELPPDTDAGLRVTLDRAVGLIDNAAVLVVPL